MNIDVVSCFRFNSLVGTEQFPKMAIKLWYKTPGLCETAKLDVLAKVVFCKVAS